MSLKRSAASGVSWTGLAVVGTGVLQVAQIAVLARLLPPQDFGLMAMILVALGFVQAFSDMGVSNAIIHRQDVTRNQLSSLFWLNVLAGVVVYGIAVAMAPLVAYMFREPPLQDLMVWAALVLLIAPFGQQFQVLLQKELRFKALGVVELTAAAGGAAVSIGCALAGQGVFSLIWGQIAAAAVKAGALLGIGLQQWRPALRFRRSDLAGYLEFGLYQMAERFINYVNSRLDQLLVGTILGAQALGYYNLAFNLVIQPVLRLNPVLTRVAFPLFATIQNDPQRLTLGFMTLQRVVALINFPLLIGITVVAPVFVPVVLGEQWAPSIVLIQILAFVALLRALGNPTGSLLLAKGRADLGFYFSSMILLTQIPAVYFGTKFGGAIGVAAALLLTQSLYYCANYLMNVRRILGPCLRSHLGSITPALVTSGLMAPAVAALSLTFAGHDTVMLALQVGFGAAIYLGLNWLLYRNQARQVISLIGAARA